VDTNGWQEIEIDNYTIDLKLSCGCGKMVDMQTVSTICPDCGQIFILTVLMPPRSEGLN